MLVVGDDDGVRSKWSSTVENVIGQEKSGQTGFHMQGKELICADGATQGD